MPRRLPPRRALLCLSILVPAACAIGCSRPPSARFLVSIAAASPDRLAVTLELHDVPRDGLTIKGYAAQEALRVGEVTAAGPDGARLPVEPGIETIAVNSRAIDIPRFVLRGPLPTSVLVRYVVTPGNREGDAHMGFSGRCHGYLDGRFGFVSGRNLFLLPQPAEALRSIEVRFSLPQGFTVEAPWRRAGDSWRPGVGGDLAAEHLVSAAIGLGRFRERAFEVGGTRFRLAFESGIPAEQEEQAAARLERVARYLHGLFGRGLGPEYLTVLVPRAPTGDEIVGEGWGTGQGQTLSPLTPGRLQQFAEHLIDAYVRHAPYRTEIKRPEEFWLVDGIRNLYSWRAVAEAGLMPREEVTRQLAVGYLTALNVHGLQRNLETIYSKPGSFRIERETLAPFVLASLDHDLRVATKEATSLDAAVALTFKGTKAPSLWAALPRAGAATWKEFREKYVQAGADVIPVEPLYTLPPTRPQPDPPGGKVVRSVTLVYTGKTNGYLENCGCKVNQSGGVARRATMLERIRKSDPGVILLDAGDAFIRPEKQNTLDFLSREEQALFLRTMDLMRYQAAGIGTTELTFGPDHFRAETRGTSIPYRVANVRAGGVPLAPAAAFLRSGPTRVAVIGIFEPPWGSAATSLFEENTASLVIDDPFETLRREVPALKKQADLVIALGRLTPETVRRVARGIPDLDAIVSDEYDAPTKTGGAGDDMQREDHPGFLGRTLVAYTTLTNYGLGSVTLGLDSAGRIASAAFKDLWLYEDVPDQPRVRDMLNRFYDDVGRRAAAQESVPPLFADDPVRLGGRYVGAAKCADCHKDEYGQWMTTKHASAYKTLLDRHRHFQPKCISCHVVGYGTPHGYRLGAAEQTLANVQCEVCHGPGAEHVAAPSTKNIRRAVPEKVCLECHTPDHSDHFVYAERLPKIRHDHFE
ncbi:MAG TPA: multiheme c-type cytochrome [Candidatus Polarisedimenticolia bacterium]|nr:multiheme c-type cytochrome [Candidatus Polarisedimenticolia bacterium]